MPVGVGMWVGEGVIGVMVGVGAWVFSGVGVGVGGRGVKVMVGWCVSEGRRVKVGARVPVPVGVKEGVALGTGVGGWPSTVKRPEVFQLNPIKICTSYSPTSQRQGSGFQSVYPTPPVPPSQGLDS